MVELKMRGKAVEMGIDPKTVLPEDLELLAQDEKGRDIPYLDLRLATNILKEANG